VFATQARFQAVPLQITGNHSVEHSDGKEVTPTFVGQAHNQMNRAISEYQHLGYAVCGTILTHLEAIDPSLRGRRRVRSLRFCAEAKEACIALKVQVL
jgi:hypothetical protein